MGRFAHQLQHNKTSQTPSRFIFYDTETIGEEYFPDSYTDNLVSVERHKLKVGVALFYQKPMGKNYKKEEWFTFYDVETFWNWVEKIIRPRQKIVIISHNQNFDFLIMNGFEELVNRGWTIKKCITDNGIWIIKYKKASMTLEFLDTFNWFKKSLKELGEIIGEKKIDIDLFNSPLDELIKYCKQDVNIVRYSVLNWIDFIIKYDMGNFSPTLASQAFSAYTHRFMSYPIMIHANKFATDLERASYRGGRNECFFIGKKENVHVLDFNSLYPSVMKDYDYPTKLIFTKEEVSIRKLIEYLEKFCVIADCVISIDKPAIAYKIDKLIFPIGKFRVTLTTPELNWVLENGEIEVINSLVAYQKGDIFYDYVKELYELRKQFQKINNDIYDELTKILLNSLYGKFGQRIRKIEKLGKCDKDLIMLENCYDEKTGTRYSLLYYGGEIIKSYSVQEEAINSFPAIASHVTSYGRMKLYNAIEIAGFENVYYADTDSLFVNDEGLINLKELISNSELGMLKHEYSTKELTINGCKDYEVDKKIKRKGIRKDAKQIEENVFEQIKFCKFKSMLRKECLNAVDIETITKELKREYDKGIVLKSGQIEPFKLTYP